MMWLILLFSFVFGTIVGSFLNVLILRYNTGRTLGGRSACFSCGIPLASRELIPLISFVMLRGRCRSCGASISWQYPAVEFITGVVFTAVIYKQLFNLGQPADLQFLTLNSYDLLSTFYFLLTSSLLIAITAYDIRHKIIPNGLVWILIAVSFLNLFISAGGMPSYYDLLAGPILAAPFALIWLLSGGRAFGFGDAKLSLGLGWMFGLSGGISVILLSFWIGGLVSLFLLFGLRKGFTMKSEIPFAPFLVVSAFLVYFFNFDFIGLADLIG